VPLRNNSRKFYCFFSLFPAGSVIFLFWPSFYRVSSFDTFLAVCLPRLVRLALTLLSVNVLGLFPLNCHVYDYGLAIVAPTSLCLCPGCAFQHISVYMCVCASVRACELALLTRTILSLFVRMFPFDTTTQRADQLHHENALSCMFCFGKELHHPALSVLH